MTYFVRGSCADRLALASPRRLADPLGIDEARALDRIALQLESQRKPVEWVSERGLRFDDPIWRRPLEPGWLTLAIYDRGEVRIDQERDGAVLHYDLRSLHGMFFCTLAAAPVASFAAASGAGTALAFGAGSFSWLYGANLCSRDGACTDFFGGHYEA